MNVIVDTSAWSLAFRRKSRKQANAGERRVLDDLVELLRERRGKMLGTVRQELLSGIRDELQFQRLRERLRTYPDIDLQTADYEEAASLWNKCRRVGIVASLTDFLICAVAIRRQYAILTTDKDFGRFAKILPIRLHQPRG